MYGLVFTFHDDGHVTQLWTWRDNGENKPAAFEMVRKR